MHLAALLYERGGGGGGVEGEGEGEMVVVGGGEEHLVVNSEGFFGGFGED